MIRKYIKVYNHVLCLPNFFSKKHFLLIYMFSELEHQIEPTYRSQRVLLKTV
jgi:hypothetical protein